MNNFSFKTTNNFQIYSFNWFCMMTLLSKTEIERQMQKLTKKDNTVVCLHTCSFEIWSNDWLIDCVMDPFGVVFQVRTGVSFGTESPKSALATSRYPISLSCHNRWTNISIKFVGVINAWILFSALISAYARPINGNIVKFGPISIGLE